MSTAHDPTRLAAARLRWALTPGPDDQDHLSPAVLDALAQSRLGDVDREATDEHLQACVQCAEDLADRRTMQAAIDAEASSTTAIRPAAPARDSARPGRWSLAVAGLAAAAALVLAVSVARWGGDDAPQETQVPVSRPAGPMAAPAAVPFAPPSLSPVADAPAGPALTAQERSLVVRVLATGRLELPPDARVLAGTVGTLLGEAAAADRFGILSPRGTAVTGHRPSFAWQRAPGAVGYTVRVFDGRFAEVASGRVEGLTWTPPGNLVRGTTYSWQVTAHRAEGDLTVPAPPEPEALFRIVTADVAAMETARRARLASDPLTLGILQAGDGLVADAAVSFERAAGGATTDPALRARARALSTSLPAQGAPTTTKPAQ